MSFISFRPARCDEWEFMEWLWQASPAELEGFAENSDYEVVGVRTELGVLSRGQKIYVDGVLRQIDF